MIIKLKDGEKIDDLEIKGMKIIQNKNWFCYGMDSVLLSDFAKGIKPNSKCLDLGTGTGILGLLLCAKTKLNKILGIEIQAEVAEMAKRNIKLNNLESRFEIINIDLKELTKKENKEILNKKDIEQGTFDYIITNPPYKKLNTGEINENEKKYISRHEVTADLNEFIKTSSYLLKDKGELFMVHRPDRLVDIIELMRKQKIEPKLLKFVYPKQNKEPNLILIKGIKNAKPFLKIQKPLIIYDENGNYTDDVLKIYGKS